MDYSNYSPQERVCMAGMLKEYWSKFSEFTKKIDNNPTFGSSALADLIRMKLQEGYKNIVYSKVINEVNQMGLSQGAIDSAVLSQTVWNSMDKQKKQDFVDRVGKLFITDLENSSDYSAKHCGSMGRIILMGLLKSMS